MNSEITLRPLDIERDCAFAADMIRAFWPDHPTTPEEIERDLRLETDRLVKKRWIASRDGSDFAYLSLIERETPDNPMVFQITARMAKSNWDSYGECLDLLVENARILDANKVHTWLETNHSVLVAEAVARGFVAGQTNPVSKLNLQNFDPSLYQAHCEKALASGVEIHTFEQLAGEGDPSKWIKKFYDIEMELMADVPLPEPFQPEPYEEFEKEVLAYRDEWPMVWFAHEGDRVWGTTGFHLNKADESIAHTDLTGVIRGGRRRGIATLLKVTALTRAKELGVKSIGTDNEENNPMYELNRWLGFEKAYDDVCYSKTLKDQTV